MDNKPLPIRIRHRLLGHRWRFENTYRSCGYTCRKVTCADCGREVEQCISKVWGIYLPELGSHYDWDIIGGYLAIFLIILVAGIVGA